MPLIGQVHLAQEGHDATIICPASTLEISMSVGPPSARAVSDGSHDSMNGTAAKATPRAPYTVVAVRRNFRRLVLNNESHVVEGPASSCVPLRIVSQLS
jgi:hypothetical protein